MNTATDAPVTPVPGAIPLAAVVPLADLYPSPSNPRKHFADLGELALSLSRKGVEIPLLVRARESAQGAYEIVDGERRYRAAQAAGLQFVPVIRRDTMTDADVLELQLENAMQRSDLTPLEEARGIKALLKSSSATPAEIATRMSRSERFIADRLRLLALIPDLQQLLDQQRIGIEHADRLSKLTKEDQERAVHPGEYTKHGRIGDPGGLWTRQGRTLDFGGEDPGDDGAALTRDPYAGLKVVTVKELEAWIARHVRFDVDRMAKTAPLEFGRVKGQVDLAAATPGRGKKVIEITHDAHLADEVRDPAKRVFGPRSWKRADGTVASSWDARGKAVDSPTCAHSVLGVVSIGPEYGTAFQVCLAKDVCTVHWGAEIRAKQKIAKQQAAGQTEKAAATAARAKAQAADAERQKEARRLAVNRLYRRVYPDVAAAILAAAPAADSPRAIALLWHACELGPKVPKDVTTVDHVVRAVLTQALDREAPRGASDSTWTNYEHELQSVRGLAKDVGVTTAVEAIIRAAELAIAAESGAKAVPAKATPRRKASAGAAR